MRLTIDAEVDEAVWSAICRGVLETSPPRWASPILSMALAELKTGEQAAAGVIAGVEAIFMPIEPDYLEFLRTQIRLNARGDDWSALLQTRLHRLEPFVDTKLFHLLVTRDDRDPNEHMAYWYLAPPDWRVIHWEYH